MLTFLIRRLLFLFPILWGVSTLVFFLIHMTPGDPVEMMLGEQANPGQVEALRRQLGLHLPLHVQYYRFMTNLLQGDLGTSFHTRSSVTRSILRKLPATVELAVVSLLLAVLIAIPIGIVSATRRGSLLDRSATVAALLGISIPNFWLGPLLIIFFSIKLDLLPVSGRGSLAHLILPGITLGTALAAVLTRMTRSSMLEVLGENYIQTARAKGLTDFVVFYKHALKNAIIPVITILGLQFGALLAGAIITEKVFSWPGIGSLMLRSIHYRDYPMVQGCILFIAFAYVLANLIADVSYGLMDPRIRLGGEGDR